MSATIPMTRRGLVASAAATLAATGAAGALASQSVEADPIFAAIEAHRAAWDDLERNCSALDERSAEDEIAQLHAAVDGAEDDMIGVIPTTLAGIAALLTYVADYVARGNAMGGYYEDDASEGWAAKHGVEWEVVMHRNLARAIDAIIAANASFLP